MSASRKDPVENNLTCPKPRPTWASTCPPPLDSHHESSRVFGLRIAPCSRAASVEVRRFQYHPVGEGGLTLGTGRQEEEVVEEEVVEEEVLVVVGGLQEGSLAGI
ncbi:hypothetical protein D9C73_024645 [Collichthys lucidus]|uniref:Uncharacterized protein n=1 Tax=Collichthys lucidus TaxID=240159 RepID=A0A4U5VPN5_COLLU|nr:hypothetical protein D9C73_024645 [Collichthys lucidus]